MNAPVLMCPCCGQPVPSGELQAASLARTLGIAGIQASIVDLLAKRPGQWVPTDRIIFAMYADTADGEPDTASTVLRVLLSRLRPRLGKAGYTIETRWGGRGAKDSYRRLVRVAA